MFYQAVRFNFNIMLRHLPGHNNYLADLLSRLQVPASSPTHGHSTYPTPAKGLEHLISLATALLTEALSSSTRKAYASAFSNFRAFCCHASFRCRNPHSFCIALKLLNYKKLFVWHSVSHYH